MTPRNPITALILAFVLPVAYVLYWTAITGNELREQGADVPPWWYVLIPIIGLVHLWKVCKGVEQLTGTASASTLMLLSLLLPPLGIFMAQKSLNGRALRPAAAM